MVKLEIQKGSSIGYNTPLANALEQIELTQGNHFLLARNGRGKTTLLRSIAGSIRFLAGGCEHNARVHIVRDDLLFEPALNAKHIFSSFLNKQQLKDALAFAEQIELDTKRPFGKLSFGNRHKVSLILAEFSAQCEQASILLLDEPYTGLDSVTRNAFDQLWQKEQYPILRLISCHPDFDAVTIKSAIMITDSNILHKQDPKGIVWGSIKDQLH